MLNFGRALQLGFGIVMVYVLIACGARGNDSYGLSWQMGLIALGALAIVLAARRGCGALEKRLGRCKSPQSAADRVFIIMAAVMFAIQLYCGYKLTLAPITDLGYTDRAARQLAENWDISRIYETMPARHDKYFAIYPNNQILLLLLTGIYKVQYALTGSMNRSAPIFVNALALNISYIYMYRSAKLMYKNKQGGAAKALFAAICGAGSSVFYTYVPFYYTDSLSMPFVMAAFYRYLRGLPYLKGEVKRENLLRALPQMALCALYTALGFKMKGSVIVLLPAFMLYTAIAESEERRRGVRRLAKGAWAAVLAALVIGFIAAASAFTAAFHIADEQDYARYKFPPHHWIMMGMKTRGGYSYRDFQYTLNYETYEEKEAADVTRSAERLENFGFGGMVFHFFKKAAYTWSDGSYLIFYHINSGESSALREFVTSSKVFRYMCTLYHFAMLAAVTAGYFAGCDECRGEKKRVDESWLMRIIFAGVLVFFELWETRSRYLVNFAPIFIMLAADFCNHDGLRFVRKKEKAPNEEEAAVET